MGNAEYEFGVVKRMYDQMREFNEAEEGSGILVTALQVAVSEGEPLLWYVGRVEQLSEAQALVSCAISNGMPETKASTNMSDKLRAHCGLPSLNKWVSGDVETTGWWAYSEHSRGTWEGMECSWAVFLSENDARDFLAAVCAQKVVE
jgi:hypothetical protein